MRDYIHLPYLLRSVVPREYASRNQAGVNPFFLLVAANIFKNVRGISLIIFFAHKSIYIYYIIYIIYIKARIAHKKK